MEKMRFESVDGFQENIRRLADIFPSCVKEQKDNDGKTIRKVDINTLQLLLGINQKESETCEFSWVGKRKAVKEVYKPIRKTLRPVVQDSVEWDSTGNLYIEGDNLDVLKLLQESYLDSVKVKCMEFRCRYSVYFGVFSPLNKVKCCLIWDWIFMFHALILKSTF